MALVVGFTAGNAWLSLGLVAPANAAAGQCGVATSPAPGASGWENVQGLGKAREGLAAATDCDGRVYAIGGEIPSGVTGSVEVFDKDWNRTAGYSLKVPRGWLTAATDRYGRIYAIGGYRRSSNFFGKEYELLNTVEMFDPKQPDNGWVTMAPMPTPRSELAAATGPDGRIYVFGGVGRVTGPVAPAADSSPMKLPSDLAPARALNTVEAFTPPDPVDDPNGGGSWAQTAAAPGQPGLAPMPTARRWVAAATGSDGIYVIGGASDESLALNTVEVFHPNDQGGYWTTSATSPPVPQLPSGRNRMAAVALPESDRSRIYVVGGNDGNDGTLATMESYALGETEWKAEDAVGFTPRRGLAGARGGDGRLYAIGGSSPTAGGLKADVQAYRPGPVLPPPPTPSLQCMSQGVAGWERLGDHLPTRPIQPAMATGGDGRVYVVGGHDPDSQAGLDAVKVCDRASGEWVDLPGLPTPRSGLAAAVGIDTEGRERIYAFGGQRSGNVVWGAVAVVEGYDPATKTWKSSAAAELVPMPTPRTGAAAVALGGLVYVVGGEDADGNTLNTVDVYDSAKNTWTPGARVPGPPLLGGPAPMPTARAHLAAVAGPDGRLYAMGGDTGGQW